MSNKENNLNESNQKGLKDSFDRNKTLVEKRAEGKIKHAEFLNGLKEFPLARNDYIISNFSVKGDEKETEINVTLDWAFLSDPPTIATSTVVPYRFEIPVDQFVSGLNEVGDLTKLVATLVLFTLEVPLSIQATERKFSDFNAGKHVKIAAFDGYPGLLEQISHMVCQRHISETIAFFAWNDRMTIYRNVVHKHKQARFIPTLNPREVLALPISHEIGKELNLTDTDNSKGLASLSWGKESLLTIVLAQKIHKDSGLKLGLIQHILKGEQGYQDAYATYLPGSPIEHLELSTAKSGYLQLLHAMTLNNFGPTHGLHHIYAIAHLINNYQDVEVAYMGDEAERTMFNPLYRHAKDENNFVLTLDDIRSTDRYMELKDERGLVSSSDLEEAGFDLTFDFHQSQPMADCLNGLFSSMGMTKRVSSLIYSISEMQIQHALHRLDPELMEHQVSCWFADDPSKSPNGSKWCNSCFKCARLAWMMKSLGIDHEGIFGLKFQEPTSILEHGMPDSAVFAVDADVGDPAYEIVVTGVNYMRHFAGGGSDKLDYVKAHEHYMTQPCTHLRSHPTADAIVAPFLKELALDKRQ